MLVLFFSHNSNVPVRKEIKDKLTINLGKALVKAKQTSYSCAVGRFIRTFLQYKIHHPVAEKFLNIAQSYGRADQKGARVRCARSKQNLHLPSGARASLLPPGSIFFWRPLHLSDRSRGVGLCLNTSFVCRLAPGGCWSALSLVVGLGLVFILVAFRVVTVVSFSSFGFSGSRSAFQSSPFRGAFQTCG